MTQNFEFARWATRLRALLVVAFAATFVACDAADKLTNTSDEPAVEAEPVSVTDADLASSFRGGIPMGTFAQPTHTLGARFNGALRNIWPAYLRKELAAIKARGGRVVLTFVGNERHYKTRGRFDFAKWKARVNRFRSVNFDQYIKDGTIIGHYLIDEPNDQENWGRGAISPAMIEEMAKYSKKLWPNLTTIVRVQPDYLGRNHRYLDAAWAQYVYRKGTAANYIRTNVAEAQKRGLGLIVGLNFRRGGPRGRAMTPREITEWGSTLLSSSYPCAFISWQYTSALSSRAMSAAFDVLRRRAQSRSTKSCR